MDNLTASVGCANLLPMKTVSSDQVVEEFDKYSKLAHDGEKILVTREGRPWVLLAPPAPAPQTEAATTKLHWPDFSGRLSQFYLTSAGGPTATELLSKDKEDRF